MRRELIIRFEVEARPYWSQADDSHFKCEREVVKYVESQYDLNFVSTESSVECLARVTFQGRVATREEANELMDAVVRDDQVPVTRINAMYSDEFLVHAAMKAVRRRLDQFRDDRVEH